MLGKKLIQAAAVKGGGGGGGGNVLGVEDVFSTFLYTGTGSTQTITNGIDLAGEGGMVWIKRRDSPSGHYLTDTARGTNSQLQSNEAYAESNATSQITSFNGDGFSIGSSSNINNSSGTYASWSFRKAEKFFDVVTYTGTGVDQAVPHSLGVAPKIVIIKKINDTSDWQVYSGPTEPLNCLELNLTNPAVDRTGTNERWSSAPTSTAINLATHTSVNNSGDSYVAYLFAHDAGGFGADGTESVIKCGSYTGTSSVDQAINVGWEPQWVMVKCATSSSGPADWMIFDGMRGWGVRDTGDSRGLRANTAAAEANTHRIHLNSTGFEFQNEASYTMNASGETYIYIAIRRGPMKTPEDATKVFDVEITAGTTPQTATTGFPVDLILNRQQSNTSDTYVGSRLTGKDKFLRTDTTAAESAGSDIWKFDLQGQIKTTVSSNKNINWMFRRAPGFFDVVAYTGTGVARTVPHNLGVAPELIIIKSRSNAYAWRTSALFNASTYITADLNSDTNFTANVSYGSNYINSQPSATSFAVTSNGSVNQSAATYIAYLFATLPGISKIGSYTGTGTTLNIDCGFTAGARFVLIKRTDSTGDWYVCDTARGIVSGKDPFLLLNSPSAEDTSTDYIDPLSSGFQISSSAPDAINANGGTYIYLAIA